MPYVQEGPITVVALGVVFAVGVEDELLRRTVDAVLTDLRPASPPAPLDVPGVVEISIAGAGPYVVAAAGGRTTVETRADALAQALTAVNLAAVMAPSSLTCHAAVLTRDGRTLVLPGPSGRGKTTLTAALLLEGWAYVTDEALALPWAAAPPERYPRPLSLSGWSRAALGLPRGVEAADEDLFRPSDLGADVAREVPPVSNVLLVHRPAVLGRPSVTAAHRQDALKELMARGFTTPTDPARALEVLALVLRKAAVHIVDVGAPRETAVALSRYLGVR